MSGPVPGSSHGEAFAAYLGVDLGAEPANGNLVGPLTSALEPPVNLSLAGVEFGVRGLCDLPANLDPSNPAHWTVFKGLVAYTAQLMDGLVQAGFGPGEGA